MKIKLTIILFGLLFFGCNITNSKNTPKEEKGSETVEKDKIEDHNTGLNDDEIKSINNVITLFKESNIDKISEIISYPLYRKYPIPPIRNKKEFKQRFNQVFDKILIDKIANSKIEQWSEVGWRGIMLDNGIVWMANSDGIITSVNYQSNYEKIHRNDLISKEKEQIHTSLKIYENPIYKIKTKNYLIRIDEVSDNEYRYASWKVENSESSLPDIILNNGKWDFEGSGGNHVITFTNKNYTYKVYRNIIGETNAPDITINVEKDNETILKEHGTLIIE